MSKDVQFNLRIPAELKAKIEDAAKTNNRSINAEAMNRLEQSFVEPLLVESISETSNYLFQIGLLRGEVVAYEMALSQSLTPSERAKYRLLVDSAKTKLMFFREKFNAETKLKIQSMDASLPW